MGLEICSMEMVIYIRGLGETGNIMDKASISGRWRLLVLVVKSLKKTPVNKKGKCYNIR